MDNLLLSEVQIIEKNRKQTKTTVGLYWEVYFRKTKGIIKILVKKKIIKKNKEKKRKEQYWTSLTEKDWIKSRKQRYAKISIGHYHPAKKKSINFYSNQGLDFRWVDNNRREWEVDKRAKVSFLVMEPPR